MQISVPSSKFTCATERISLYVHALHFAQTLCSENATPLEMSDLAAATNKHTIVHLQQKLCVMEKNMSACV